MPKRETVTLKEPITGHAGRITSLVVREPTAKEYFDIGEPQILARNPDGTLYTVENDKAVQAYLDRCIEGADSLLLGQLSLADAIMVKHKLLGFFLSARAAT